MMGEDRLHRGENILLLDEAHFQVELVELSWQAVGARVFITETGRDLEVAVEAGDHQQLLILLRSLGESVELAGMDARGDKEVARAFRRGRSQDRRRNSLNPASCMWRRIDFVISRRFMMMPCSVSRRRSRKRYCRRRSSG